MLAASALFLMAIAVLLGAAIESLGAARSMPIDGRAREQPGGWPTYSILVALYREAAVADQLLRAMAALDYRAERLEILFLLESDDPETALALAPACPRMHGWSSCRTASPAPSRGRSTTGSPRRPAPTSRSSMQRTSGPRPAEAAVMLFEQASPRLQCLQGRLCIDNLADGWLPLMMAIEYMALFDSLKCGLARAGLPVPLGGTSNHFRRADLVALGGWDPWNVAEDADLGLRIARRGGLVRDLDSTTYEEAPIDLDGWLRQRRRWFKGWLQTAAVNARRPRATIGRMGLTPWLVGQIGVLGLVLSALFFPFFSAWIAWNYWTGDLFDAETPLALAANSVAIVVVGTGGLTMAAPALIGLRRRRLWHLAPWLITLPLYLLLVSCAAWMAVWDLNRRPFQWHKTEHGRGRRNLDLFRSRR